MEKTSDSYEASAEIYIRLVRQESSQAADAIELIHTAFGAHAALRAALLITFLKIEVQQNHWVPGIGLYSHLLEGYPDALPLTQYAMRCCLRSWDISVAQDIAWMSLASA